jgi:2-succinyl-5-enolpyruvyl-6-hydroxy-3-cyclohexene-1-carboxylate synthase
LQAIHNIAEILAQKGVTHAILSPGSRCAPITIALVRHPKITTKTISDERSAAFIALGLAQTLKQPVALLCTSGTAALNYAPAIAEAYFRQIPLIVITADRPTEWIDQLDGQTIRQQQLFGQHIKASYHIPTEHHHTEIQWFINRTFNEAINISTNDTKGPVHINIALREPLYPNAEVKFDPTTRIIERLDAETQLSAQTWHSLATSLQSLKTIMVIVGQHEFNETLLQQLSTLQKQYNLVIVGDFISNISSVPQAIKHHDVFLGKAYSNTLKPDLLITFGLSLISKALKQFVRNNPPKAHWHIQQTAIVADTFKTLTKHIPTDIGYFIENSHLLGLTKTATQTSFFEAWQMQEQKAKSYLQSFFKTQDFGEFETIQIVLGAIKEETVLHLSNSMTVRYANILSTNQTVEVMANRGTSGIDGSTSTALGASLANQKTHLLITGDMAFFYDRNALWNNYIKSNFKIIVLNNHAGGIFRIIDGPKNQPELEEYFETTQALDAEKTAIEHGFNYFKASNKQALLEALPLFLGDNNKASLLEVFTDSKTNAMIFENYKNGFQA